MQVSLCMKCSIFIPEVMDQKLSCCLYRLWQKGETASKGSNMWSYCFQENSKISSWPLNEDGYSWNHLGTWQSCCLIEHYQVRSFRVEWFLCSYIYFVQRSRVWTCVQDLCFFLFFLEISRVRKCLALFDSGSAVLILLSSLLAFYPACKPTSWLNLHSNSTSATKT
jgi:hypothetical protein